MLFLPHVTFSGLSHDYCPYVVVCSSQKYVEGLHLHFVQASALVLNPSFLGQSFGNSALTILCLLSPFHPHTLSNQLRIHTYIYIYMHSHIHTFILLFTASDRGQRHRPASHSQHLELCAQHKIGAQRYLLNK